MCDTKKSSIKHLLAQKNEKENSNCVFISSLFAFWKTMLLSSRPTTKFSLTCLCRVPCSTCLIQQREQRIQTAPCLLQMRFCLRYHFSSRWDRQRREDEPWLGLGSGADERQPQTWRSANHQQMFYVGHQWCARSVWQPVNRNILKKVKNENEEEREKRI